MVSVMSVLMRRVSVRALSVALCVATLAVAVAKDELTGIDTVTLYGLELPIKPPQADSRLSDDFQKKNEKLFELRGKVSEVFAEMAEASGEENEAKRKRKLTKALEKLAKAEKAFYKEAKKIRDKFDKNFKPLRQKKEKLEEDIAKAEEKGDERTATKLAQNLQKFSGKYENMEKMSNTINSFLYITENAKLLDYAEMAGIAPERVLPADLVEALQAMADAGGKKIKDKAEPKADKDDDQPQKKSRRKRSKDKDE